MAAQELVDENVAFPDPRAGTGSPFVVEERETANPASPAPVDPVNPPAYTEAMTVNHRDSGAPSLVESVEHTPLLNRRSAYLPPYQYRRTDTNHVRQQKGLVRVLLLWLGIGQWYSGVCIFVSFLFFAGGAIIIVLSAMTLNALYEIKLTTIAAGIVFLLLSALWPCAWLWNQWNITCGCSYTPLVTYTWLLSVVYTAIVGALVFGVNENYDCVHFCTNCTFSEDPHYKCEFVEMSLWTMMAMILLMLVFVLVACIYCVCQCFACFREDYSHRNYSLL